MSAALTPLTTDEFLAWERAQPGRYEFDGIQPVAMTGASSAHAWLRARLIAALANRRRPPCEVFTNELKVLTPGGRVRYPDATVACGGIEEGSDILAPVVVLEITSPPCMRRRRGKERRQTPR